MCICRQCAQNAHRLKLVAGKHSLRIAARTRCCRATPNRKQCVGVLKRSGLAERNFTAGFAAILGPRSGRFSRKLLNPPVPDKRGLLCCCTAFELWLRKYTSWNGQVATFERGCSSLNCTTTFVLAFKPGLRRSTREAPRWWL